MQTKEIEKYIFLLGGHDLEMQVIAQILADRNVIFKDNHLQWDNALLSQYEEDMQQYGNKEPFIIYGVELKEDVTPPTNYIRIDHHNNYATYPSALEQVASILNYTLNRYQSLVAANDKAYIPGMQKIGASSEEINLIRLEDRKAQGITKNDEILAQEVIKNGIEKIGGLYVIFTTINRFSPICDRLYPYEKLLIYTPDELIYYGKGVNSIKKILELYIPTSHIFWGGGLNGFIGVSSTLAVSNIRNRTYTNYEVYLIGYGYGKFKEKIHFME